MKEYLNLAFFKELDSKGLSAEESINILEGDFSVYFNQSRLILSLAEEAKTKVQLI